MAVKKRLLARLRNSTMPMTIEAINSQDCDECKGSGVVERIAGYDRPCDVCRGSGSIGFVP